MARNARRQSDGTLAALQARIRALERELRFMREPIIRFDLGRDRRISNADEGLARVTGRSTKRLNGLKLDELVSPRQGKLAVVFDHYLNGTPYPGPAKPFLTMEFRGTGRHFEFSFRPTRDARRTIRGFRVTGRDVTHELLTKRIEQYHRTGDAIHRTIDRLHLGCLHAYNTRGRQFTRATLIGGVSNCIAECLGYRTESVQGREFKSKPELFRHSITRLITPETVHALNRSLSKGEEGWTDGEVLARDGARRPARFSIMRDLGVWGNTVFTVLMADRGEDTKLLRALSDQLADSEERYRALFEQAHDAVFVLTPEGRIVDCNKQACELAGRARDELVKCRLEQLVPKPLRSGVPLFRRQVQERGHATIEGAIQQPDGTVRKVLVSETLLRTDGGEMIYSICSDLSERDALQEQLRQSEEKYRSLFENVRDAIFVTDLADRILDCNQGACDTFGYTREEMLTLSPTDLTTESFRGELDRFRRSVRRRGYGIIQARSRRKDGSLIEAEVSVTLVHTLQGDRGYLIHRDITERKRLERERHESEEKYRGLFENANDPIFLEDFDGNILDCNKRACELYGYTRKQMLALNARAFVLDEDLPALHAVIAALKRHGSFRGESRNRRRDGSLLNVEVGATAVELGGRQLALVICHDITERRRAEEALRESEARCRALVEQSLQGLVVAQGLPPRLVFANPAIAGILGYSVEELLALSPEGIGNLVYPNDRALFFSGYRDLLAGKPAIEARQVCAVRRDGVLCWVEMSANRIEYRGEPAVQATFVDVTERRRAEEALQASERRYRVIVEDQTELICRFRPDGTLTFVNGAYCRYFDKTPEELIGQRFLPHIHDEDREEVQKGLASLTRENPAKAHEHRVIAPDGEIRWHHWTGRAIFDNEGRLIEFQAVGRDITERKRAEKALRESEERYRSLFDSVPIGLFRVSPDGWPLDLNPALAQMLGHPDRDSVMASRAADFYVDIEDHRKWQTVMQRDGIVRDFETTLRRRDGTPVYVQISARAVRDPNGRLLHGECVAQDITRRRLLEGEIRESEAKYRALVEASPDAVFLIDRDGRCLFVNDAAARFYGKDPEHIVGKTLFELFPQEEAQRMLRNISRILREKGNFQGEYGLTGAKGTRVLSTVLAPIRNADGIVTSAIGIARDVTDQKVLQQQLQRAARLASVGTLAAGVAHEINNPLAVIVVDLLRIQRHHQNDPFTADTCSKLTQMTKRIAKITGGLLTFAKATGGHFARRALHGTLNGALDLVQSRFDYEQKHLVREYPARLPAVRCDSDQLQQVFVNVCINALEAMDTGGTLTVSAKTSTKERTVTLRFADTGTGMTDDQLDRAFDPFYTTKETGTGLGLAISHSIVEEHGGRMSLTSELGRGTCVSVVLPLSEGKRPRTRPEASGLVRRKREASP
jgi:PAS domain S-box-containing protein